MLKLVIFDCDGVMFDSKEANREYYNHLLSRFELPLMDAEELDYVHIHNVMDSVRHIFRRCPEQDLDEIHAYRNSVDYLQFLQFMKMEDDLLEFLEKTRSHYHLAISTNRTNTMEPILKIFKLADYFGKVMTAENAKRPKPAPDALIEILDHYGCRAEEAIYIGDSTIDQEHAAACDIPLIAFKNKALDAKFHVDNFMAILNLPPFVK
ncbi:MAG: HAD family hydrolase [Thermodesulfobacteriota bacterium]